MTTLAPISSRPVPGHAVSPEALVEAAAHLGDDLSRTAAERDAGRHLPFDAVQRFATARLGTVRVPAEHGGPEGSVEQMVRIAIHLARGDSNVAQACLSHYVSLERLRLMGSAAQRAHFLPMAARGVQFGAAAAERGGQFRGEVRTTLRRQGAHHVLDGTKHYSTGALFADILKIRAVDEQGELVAVYIPRERAGVRCVDDWDGMGQRCTASGTTELQGVRVEAEEIVPMQPWTTQRHHTGALAQVIHCAIDTGIALAALHDAVAWARRGIRPVKESGVARAQDDPYVLHTLGRMAAQAHAAEALVLDAARRIDAAADARFGRASVAPRPDRIAALAAQASIATAEAKIVSTEASLLVSQLLFDVGGAATTLRPLNHDRHWRNARTHTTHDPVAYKFKAVGNHFLNDLDPPLTFSY